MHRLVWGFPVKNIPKNILLSIPVMRMRIWKTSYRSRSTYSIEDTDSNLGGKNDPEKEGILTDRLKVHHTINLKPILKEGDFYVRFGFKNYLN